MGTNFSRQNAKGLNGRRAQSSGNLSDPKIISNVSKFLTPCGKSSRESHYRFRGSLPNRLDGNDSLDDDESDNNNITDTITGNLGGTLPHKKRHSRHRFSDDSITSITNLDLIKHESQESIDSDDPWRYRQNDAVDLLKNKNDSIIKKRVSIDVVDGVQLHHNHHHHHHRTSSTLSRDNNNSERYHRSAEFDLLNGTLPKKRNDSTKRSAPSLDADARHYRALEKLDDDLLKKLHKPNSELKKEHRHMIPKSDLKLNNNNNNNSGSGSSGSGNSKNNNNNNKLKNKTTIIIGANGDPQDQGYASERSPEDEHPPLLPGQPFPNVTPENTFRVTLKKNSRGLGLSVSGGGTTGPVRVKRLFPLQPAALSNKLQPGDILLAANGIPLTGLTNYEALEVLRTTSSTVELVVCRVPGNDENPLTPPDAPPPPPPTRKDPGLSLKIVKPLPPLKVEPCGEFDIEMTKVGGSLGFTLRKADSSVLGHYVRALVREPALSDGRIEPGDKIIAVDDIPLSPMSHEEAVALLRKCGPKVKLRLYRDLAQTPVSALSPTEPDHPLQTPKTCLRQEAVDMLCDLASRKLSPGPSSSSCPRQSTSSSSPRKLRRPVTRSSTGGTDEGNRTKNSQGSSLSQETSDSDQCSIKTQLTNSQPITPSGQEIINEPTFYDVYDSSDSATGVAGATAIIKIPSANRPKFLNLTRTDNPINTRKNIQYQIDDDNNDNIDTDSEVTGPIIITDSDSNIDDIVKEINGLSSDEHENITINNILPTEPMSMPPLHNLTTTVNIINNGSSLNNTFSYKNPIYQSANPATSTDNNSTGVKNKISHSSDHDIPGKVMNNNEAVGSKGLLKWKGVMFSPNEDSNSDGKCRIKNELDVVETESLADLYEQGYEVFMVELTRGWNSRLGFSLQPEGDNTVISVVHPDSVASKDGRLKQGDILIMVNDESVEHMSTSEIIDLLRKIRGSIGITVLRKNKNNT